MNKLYFHNRFDCDTIYTSNIAMYSDEYVGKEFNQETFNKIKNEARDLIIQAIDESFTVATPLGRNAIDGRPIDSISLDVSVIEDEYGTDSLTISFSVYTGESDLEYHNRICDNTKKIVEAHDIADKKRYELYLQLKKEFEK